MITVSRIEEEMYMSENLSRLQKLGFIRIGEWSLKDDILRFDI